MSVASNDVVPKLRCAAAIRNNVACVGSTMQDADFLADAEKQKLDVEPQDGASLAALIKKVYATPKPIVDKVAELIK